MWRSKHFIPRNAAAVALAALGLFGFGGFGCSQQDARDVTVLWHLVDGRTCLDTSMVQFKVDLEGGVTVGTSNSGDCHSNAAQNNVTLSGVRVGSALHARGLSAQNLVLYRGDLRVTDPIPAVLDIGLYYIGGE